MKYICGHDKLNLQDRNIFCPKCSKKQIKKLNKIISKGG